MDNCSNPILSREEARIGSHVLVIAKPAIPREGLTLLLRQNGFDVVTAAENLERIEERACMAGSPDLIVIDLFSGDEPSAWIAGLAALRQRFSTARIVLLDHPVTAEWRDCQDFRVWAGIMGEKECHYVPTQGAGDTG